MRSAELKISKTLDLGQLGEQECEITFQYYPGYPGSFYKRNGDPGDPPEPADAEILKVTCDGAGDVIALCEADILDSDWFWESAAEAYEACMTPEGI